MQRIIGIVVGAIVAFLLLLLFDSMNVADRNTRYVSAVTIGGVSTWAWPVVLGFWLARRARAKRNERIESEVERQVASQNKRPGG